MKKIALALAIIASMQFANAQVKSISAAKSALESAKAAADNPKKATKMATWLKLGESYMQAYDAPALSGWVGAKRSDLQLVMGGAKPSATEQVEVGGQPMTKETYETCDYYFSGDALQMIITTKPIVPDALDKALVAYKKASELDVKGAKTKDISAAMKSICQKYSEQAYNLYNFKDFKASSDLFEKAALASVEKASALVDTNSFFNTGLTSYFAQDFPRAKKFFEICLNEYNYEGTDGDIYAKLADICEKTGEKAEMKNILEKGFTKFPQSQSILIGLINYYISSNEDTGRLFELIGEAKKNEPTNASLWYVEGNVNTQLGKLDDAIKAYEQCAKINPEYEYGFIGEGILYYNQAIEIQEKAQNEMDDAKYNELASQFEQSLKNCIAPFEKAFNLTKDNKLKVSVSEYLKNATYRFREEDANYQAAYEKYAKIVADGKVE